MVILHGSFSDFEEFATFTRKFNAITQTNYTINNIFTISSIYYLLTVYLLNAKTSFNLLPNYYNKTILNRFKSLSVQKSIS